MKPVGASGPALNTRPSGARNIRGYSAVAQGAAGVAVSAPSRLRHVDVAFCQTCGIQLRTAGGSPGSVGCDTSPETTSTSPFASAVFVGYHRLSFIGEVGPRVRHRVVGARVLQAVDAVVVHHVSACDEQP